MRASLLETTGAREATNDMVEGFMKHVQQLASEKNKLVEDLNQQRLLNDQIMSLRSKENDLIKQLHDKIEVIYFIPLFTKCLYKMFTFLNANKCYF